MPDRYRSFAELERHERRGIDFSIRRRFAASPVAVVAPHGGEIEPTTTEIAEAIAGDAHAFYSFEGRSHELHITSHLFDEPEALELVRGADVVIAVHGRKNREEERTVWLGGLHTQLRARIVDGLCSAGFAARVELQELAGTHPKNICNRGRHGAGAQLEIPMTLRDALRDDLPMCARFGDAVRQAADKVMHG